MKTVGYVRALKGVKYNTKNTLIIFRSGDAVIKSLNTGNVNLGIGGIYISHSRLNAGTFFWHSEDCASFISLASTALPR